MMAWIVVLAIVALIASLWWQLRAAQAAPTYEATLQQLQAELDAKKAENSKLANSAASGVPAGTVALAMMSPREQKNELGERLYSLIVKGHPEQAGKITGMILEMDNSDILKLLSNPQMLDAQVEESVMVLSQHIASTVHGTC